MWQVQTESRWFSRRRKGSLEKKGKRLRERERVTQLLPRLTFIIHCAKSTGNQKVTPVAAGRRIELGELGEGRRRPVP